MKKYRAIRDNYGFMGRYWYKDTVVELPDNVKPPHHFECIDAGLPVSESTNTPETSEPKTMSELSEAKPVTFQEMNKRKGK